MPGMVPRLWGPILWNVLHGAAAALDRRQRPDVGWFAAFLLALRWVLPCAECRHNFDRHLRTRWLARARPGGPTELESRLDAGGGAQGVLVELHDQVNHELGKPTGTTVPQAQAAASAGLRPERLFDALFFIAYNYEANGEPDKEARYLDFLAVAPAFARAAGAADAGDAVAGIRVRRGFTQEELVEELHAAMVRWGRTCGCRVPPRDQLDRMYDECRSPTPVTPQIQTAR